MGLGLTLSLAAQAGPYAIGVKEPSWIRHIDPPVKASSSKRRWTDWQETLVDRQIKVSSDGTQRFEHHARRVLNTTGVAEASEITIEYLPAFQHLDVHGVRLRRDNVWKNRLPGANIREFATEQDRDRRIYDGTHRLEISLPDVRPGDEIEYSYTIRGDNPALAGHFDSSWWLGSTNGLDREYLGVLWQPSRALWQRFHGSNDTFARTDEGASVRWSWHGDDLPAVTMEDRVPDWYDPLPFAEVSDFASWSDVAAWAFKLYDQPRDLPDDLSMKIADIAKRPTQTERLIAATQLVQDQVRYLGIELGKGALAPRRPAETWKHRYGDCKDKAFLLVAVLTRLGIEAAPALVDSSSGKTLDTRLPSVDAFDHVIVRAVADGIPRWIDATMSHVDGDIEAFAAPDYGYALVVAANTSALTRMPPVTLTEPTTEVVETYSLLPDSRVRLQVSTRYRRDDAARLREQLEQESKQEIGREYLNYYARQYPDIEQTREMEATHHPNGDVSVTEEYRISRFFDDGKRTISAWSIADALAAPRIVKRRMPLALPYPAFIRHTLIIDWAPDTDLAADAAKLQSPSVSFTRRGQASGGKATLVYELRTRSDHVDPADVAKHLDVVNRIQDDTDYELQSAPSAAAAPKEHFGYWAGAGGTLFGGLLALGIWRGRRRRSWRKRHQELPGETAASAISVTRTDDIERRIDALRCRCGRRGARLTSDDLRSVRYDGRDITSAKVACRHCGEIATRYFVLLDS